MGEEEYQAICARLAEIHRMDLDNLPPDIADELDALIDTARRYEYLQSPHLFK